MAETDLRANLASAIERVAECSAYLQRVISARSRLDDQQTAAYRAREAAEQALREARRVSAADLVSFILDGADDAAAAARDAEAALAAADAALDRVEHQREAVKAEERQARDRLVFATSARDEALVALLRDAPAVKALLASLHVARRRCASIEAALAAVPAMALPALWYAHRPEDDVADDLHLADRWKKAIASLRVDSAAELPQHRAITRIERVIVDPRADAA